MDNKKGNIGDFLKNIASQLNPFEQVYAHSMNGENPLVVVDGYDEEKIKKIFEELETFSESLASCIVNQKSKTLKQIKSTLEEIDKRGYHDLDLSRISEICRSAADEISKLSKGMKIEIKENDSPGGGVFHVVSVEGKSQGGIVLPQDDKRNDEIDGEYVSAENREKILSILQGALSKIQDVPRINSTSLNRIMSDIISQNFDSLLRQCEITSSQIQNLPEVDKVSKRTRVKALPAFLTGVALAAAILLPNPTKEFNVQSPNLGEYTVVDVMEDYDSTEIIGKFQIAEQGALDELGYGIPDR